MAIAFNLQGIPNQIRGTAEEAGAVPDLGQAMLQGFRNNLESIQGAPRLLSQKLLANQLANKIRGVEAQFAEPMAQTNYQKALTELKYLPQEKQSSLALQSLQRQIAERQLQAKDLESKIRQQFANTFLSGQTPEQANLDLRQQPNVPTKNMQPFQGTPFRLPEEMPKAPLEESIQQGVTDTNQKIVNPGNPSLYNYDAMYDKNPLYHKFFKELGMEKSFKISTNPKTNEAIIQTVHPSGKITMEAIPIGKSPGEVKFEEENAKNRAKFLDESAANISALESSQSNFDELANVLNSRKESINAVGRMNRPFTELFGTQEQQDILGILKTQTGNIMMEAAKNIKGAFTGRDMQFVSDMKPNPSEPYYMFVAKTGAMQAFNKLALDRVNIMTDLVKNGMLPADAAKVAAKKTPFAPIMKHYQDELKQAKMRTNKPAKATLEQEAYVKSLSDEQLMSMIKQGF